MAMMHWGSKETAAAFKKAPSIPESSPSIVQTHDDLPLHNRIAELEQQLLEAEAKVIEVIKEIPVEVIREVKVIEEKIVQVPYETIKEVERIVEKEVQVIKEFPVYKETIVKEFIDKPIEVIKEVEKEVVREIKFVPLWAYGVLLVQTLAIIILLIK